MYHKLDVSDQKSIDMVYERIKDKHGTLDVLVNNASVAYGSSGPGLAPERANEMVGINYYGTLNVSDTCVRGEVDQERGTEGWMDGWMGRCARSSSRS